MLGTESTVSCLPCHPHAPKECGQPATLVSLGWLLTGLGTGVSAGPQAAASEPLRRAPTAWGCRVWPAHLPVPPVPAPPAPPVLCTRVAPVVLWWTAAAAGEAPYNYV